MRSHPAFLCCVRRLVLALALFCIAAPAFTKPEEERREVQHHGFVFEK